MMHQYDALLTLFYKKSVITKDIMNTVRVSRSTVTVQSVVRVLQCVLKVTL